MVMKVGPGVIFNPIPLSAPILCTAVTSGTTAVIPFSAPIHTGCLPITKYVAVSSPGCITVTTSTSAQPLRVPNLTLLQTYNFTVRAYNGFGPGPASTTNNVVPTNLVPDPPTITSVTFVTCTSVNVAYTKPSFDGYTPITSYTAYSTTGSHSATVFTACSGSIPVTGLFKGGCWAFTVKATNAVGASTASNTSTAVHFVDPTSVLFTGNGSWKVPKGVTRVSVVAIGAGAGGQRGAGGQGGHLSYTNCISVVPCTVYTITVGRGGNGGAYYYSYSPPVGQVNSNACPGGSTSGVGVSASGGSAGSGGGPGGNGAGGYGGTGGPGTSGILAGGGGGGIGPYGGWTAGSSGVKLSCGAYTGGGSGGGGGSAGGNSGGSAGSYSGGGGGGYGGGGGGWCGNFCGYYGGKGADGALRIVIPGTLVKTVRQFPNTCVSTVS